MLKTNAELKRELDCIKELLKRAHFELALAKASNAELQKSIDAAAEWDLYATGVLR